MAALPPLTELGRDVRDVPAWRRTASLIVPFVSAATALTLLSLGQIVGGVLAVIVLTFVTYGSVSHDLVHRTYKLPRRANAVLLTAMEMTTLRSGTAYRLSHLNHHRFYPTADRSLDTESKAAGRGVLAGLLDGPPQQLRIFMWAWAHHRKTNFAALLGEGVAIVLAWTAAILVALLGNLGPLLYAALVTMGAWTIPLITVTLPHDPAAPTELTQTRAFRGLAFDLFTFGHLYHLEHHLYPSVPHQRWRELSRRLDPYLQSEGVEPVTVTSAIGRIGRR